MKNVITYTSSKFWNIRVVSCGKRLVVSKEDFIMSLLEQGKIYLSSEQL